MTKYLIYHKLGSAYSLDSMNEITQYPLSKDGTFNTEDSCIVETWEECKEDEIIIKRILGAEIDTDNTKHCWNEEKQEWYGVESCSPNKGQCLGCLQEVDL